MKKQWTRISLGLILILAVFMLFFPIISNMLSSKNKKKQENI